jgi:hypothetical protein
MTYDPITGKMISPFTAPPVVEPLPQMLPPLPTMVAQNPTAVTPAAGGLPSQLPGLMQSVFGGYDARGLGITPGAPASYLTPAYSAISMFDPGRYNDIRYNYSGGGPGGLQGGEGGGSVGNWSGASFGTGSTGGGSSMGKSGNNAWK